MRTFHDILADIERELAATDMIPTNAPTSVAAFLRELLARHVRTLPARTVARSTSYPPPPSG